jgi:flagellar motor protein MotB
VSTSWEERESELEGELNRGALWAVTYGDLMSYLMIFFLILYASESSRSVSMQMGLQGVEEQFGKESTVVTELFSRYGVQRIAKLEVGEDKMRILFHNPVLFDIGRAKLKPTASPHLRQLVAALSELPNPIQIEGHTDNIPLGRRMKFRSNWELSSARAFEVLRFFEKEGLPPERLSAIGYGEYRPLESNATAKGRGANRRIEVNIMRRRE